MTSSERITKLLKAYPAGAKATRYYDTKPNGDRRPIAKPNKELNKWLKLMNKTLRKHYNNWPSYMHGGIKKRSYISYARVHVNRQCVITIDIRKCFDSITLDEVTDSINQHLKLAPDVCKELAERLCFRGKIAQGFATSNYLSNLYLLNPLKLVNKDLKKQGILFSNYVDDLALSGSIQSKDAVINQIAVILSQSKLSLNKAKILVMPGNKQQLICGLVVNKRLSLTKSLKLKLLSDIANARMSPSSLGGWLANISSIDPRFRQKLHNYAVKKGLIKNV